MGDNPWDRNEGKYDRPSSAVPKTTAVPVSTLPYADDEPREKFRGIASVFAEPADTIDVMSGDVRMITEPTVSGVLVTVVDVGAYAAPDPSLKSIVDRLLRLRSERADITTDIGEVLKEAEHFGFARKVLTVLCRRLEKDPVEIANGDMLLALYEDELGLSPEARVLMERAVAPPPPEEKPPTRKETAREKHLREARAWASQASSARH